MEAREAIPLFESPEQAIIPFKLEKLIDKQYEAIDGLSEIFKSIRSVRGKSYDRDLEEKIAKHLEGLNLDTEKNLMRIIIAEKAGVKAKIDTFNARQISLFGKDAKLIDTDAADFIASRETIRRFAIGNYLSSKIQRVKIGQDDIHSIYYNDLDFWLELLEGSTYKQLIGILTSHE